MSLIQAAKNLMNTVVSTVKASYVASTKYQKSQAMQSLNMARHLLEDEGAREEAPGQEGEAGRRPDQQGEEVLPEEAHQPGAGPQRVQGDGQHLDGSVSQSRLRDDILLIPLL